MMYPMTYWVNICQLKNKIKLTLFNSKVLKMNNNNTFYLWNAFDGTQICFTFYRMYNKIENVH